MQDLSVTIIQTSLYWENPTANLANLEEKIATISTQSDLIILPEMFNTGFTMNVKAVAEPMNFTTFKWMRQQAKQTKAVITGSYIVKEGENYYNRLLWMRPDGTFEKYDKRHLFRMGGEHHHYSQGTERLIVELKGWKICPLICYDLRFPVWSRNKQVVSHKSMSHKSQVISEHSKVQEEIPHDSQPTTYDLKTYDSLSYDILIYVANWPAVRSQVWDTLLQARALENQSYCIGVNRVGEDGMGLNYSGNSAVIDFKGNPLFYQKDTEVIKNQILSKQELDDFRTKFPAYLDADEFEIIP
jgi:omega-amidase